MLAELAVVVGAVVCTWCIRGSVAEDQISDAYIRGLKDGEKARPKRHLKLVRGERTKETA